MYVWHICTCVYVYTPIRSIQQLKNYIGTQENELEKKEIVLHQKKSTRRTLGRHTTSAKTKEKPKQDTVQKKERQKYIEIENKKQKKK